MKNTTTQTINNFIGKASLIALILGLGLGCRTTSSVQVINQSESNIPVREHSVQTVLWQQQSAEYKALCYQAFNLARYQIDEMFSRDLEFGKPFAIITDIDETLLDNSPYNAKMIEVDKGYTRDSWIEWGKLENAAAVPGAVEFLNYAVSKGIEIYYISNRYLIQQPETMSNLKKMGFPNVDDEHILLRGEKSGKEERRQVVHKKNNVIMLIGDNLADFSELYDGQSTAKRNELTKKMSKEFGKKFIVLPNPMYGDWETKGIYEGSYKWTPAQQDSIRKAKLISY